MKNVFIITGSGDELDAFYEQTMQYLYEKYHTYANILPDIPLSPQQIAEMDASGQLADYLADQARGDRFKYNRDDKISNGLPRRTNVRWGGG